MDSEEGQQANGIPYGNVPWPQPYPQTASENTYMMYPLNNGEAFFKQEVSADQVGVKALDDKTLYVKLKAPITYFLNLTAFHAYYPVPRHVVEKDPEIWAANDKIVSKWPFRFNSLDTF